MTTQDTHDDPWAWPCPYCGTQNPIDSAVCVACRAQLRDPEEDDLFTTVATDNAQVIDPEAPRIREALWSTEVPPEEEVAEELLEPGDPTLGPASDAAGPAPSAGPFSQASSSSREQTQGSAFGSGSSPGAAGTSSMSDSPGPGAEFSDGAHGSPDRPPQPGMQHSASPFGPAAQASGRSEPTEPRQWPADARSPGQEADAAPAAGGERSPRDEPTGSSEEPHRHITPDENGLSVAVDHLRVADREACAVPIGVCGALLGDQEVVIGLLAGHLMGHASVLMVTNTRVLVANARRWKPLLDQFLPSAELMVHLRHDRDVASLTIVQGSRLTTLDGITDVAGAMELTERIRRLAGPGG